MFLTVNTTGETKRTPRRKEKDNAKSGIVYIMKMVLDDDIVIYKIGVTSRRTVYERFFENLSAFFMSYRYIPRTTLIKHSRTTDYFKAEKMLHNEYAGYSYTFDKKFSGCTEYVKIEDIDTLKETYMRIIAECKECKLPEEEYPEIEIPEIPGM
jgi:hypothetical protein